MGVFEHGALVNESGALTARAESDGEGPVGSSSRPRPTYMAGDEDSSQAGSLEFGVDGVFFGVEGCEAGSAAVRHPCRNWSAMVRFGAPRPQAR